MCTDCAAELPRIALPCPVCALATANATICGRCLADPPPYSATLTALAYAYPADELILRLKYGAQLTLVAGLSSLLHDCVKQASRPDLIVPMPMSTGRLRSRGFNQAALLASALARSLGLSVGLEACARTQDVRPQAELKLADRAANVRGIFACRADVRGKHIAVVDDVMTSGASLAELARTLRGAGAARVSNWVLARTA